MKKMPILLITVLFMTIGYAAYNATINIYGNSKLAENLNDFKVYLSSLKVNGTEVDGINDAKDEFTISDINGDISVDIVNDSTEYDTEAYLECVKEDENVGKVWNYDYTGGEQTFTVPVSGTYKFDVWGAQGGTDSNGYHGGYGGYSSGTINLPSSDKIYIYVGEKGKNLNSSGSSGVVYAYPNSGNVRVNNPDTNNINFSTGGGSTHILSNSGNLSQFSSKLNGILIVAGGGGGACTWWLADNGGAGGGYVGSTTTKNYSNGTIANNNPTGGTQSSGGYGGGNLTGNSKESWLNGNFGVGGGSTTTKEFASASGGGGFYGGGASWGGSGAGGSGYIGNSLLSEKSMYCYSCEESSEENTKTINTTCTSATPTENCAKQGNGYARITLLSSPTNVTTEQIEIKAQESTNQVINNINSKSLICKLKLNKVSRTKKAYDSQKVWTYDYTGGEQIFIAPVNGTYKFELWGAQGGAYYQTANGSYVSGELNAKKGNKFYVYVGRSGLDSSSTDYVFNYGYQNYTKTGGGATDIRLVNGSWDSLSSLTSRIMVAGGGGAQGGLNPTDGGSPYGGSAGGLIGYQGGSCVSGNVTEHTGAQGATQTSGHAFGYVPLLNTGGSYFYNNTGGNGYWSGNFYDWVGAGGHTAVSGAGGGSSFISGHAGCVAVSSQNSTTPRSDSKGATCKDGTTDITCSYHYSNIIFKNTTMIDGNGYSWTTVKGTKTQMPSHDGLSTAVGNTGNGYAKITLISQD